MRYKYNAIELSGTVAGSMVRKHEFSTTFSIKIEMYYSEPWKAKFSATDIYNL
jgi:hypothetical protein